jgi:hypothetical protein
MNWKRDISPTNLKKSNYMLIKNEHNVLNRKQVSVKISLVSKITPTFHNGRKLIVLILGLETFWKYHNALSWKQIGRNIMEVIRRG